MSSPTRTSVTDSSSAVIDDAGARKALNLMTEALALLDRSHGPLDVCAHLDLAINRLQASIDQGGDAGH